MYLKILLVPLIYIYIYISLQCGIMVTGGEAGILNVWVPSDDENNSVENTGKCTLKELPKVSLKNHSSKPY